MKTSSTGSANSPSVNLRNKHQKEKPPVLPRASNACHAARRTVSRVLYRLPERKPATAIHLGLQLPAGSSNQPGNYPDPVYVSLFGLAPSEVYHASHVTMQAVRSYRTLSALPALLTGGLLSVALSVGSPRPAVSRHSDP